MTPEKEDRPYLVAGLIIMGLLAIGVLGAGMTIGTQNPYWLTLLIPWIIFLK